MARLLLCTGEPFCRRCCGAHTRRDRQAAKQRGRRIEQRAWRKEQTP